MKQCTKCNKTKEEKHFHKNIKNNDGLHYHCKACRKEESLKQYGLTLKDYDDLLAKQEGKCKI